MKQDDMNKQESYKRYMILMISSDGKQNNVFSISVLLPITILSGFQVAAISLPIVALAIEQKSHVTIFNDSIISVKIEM